MSRNRNDDTLLFGRFGREECGLPPVGQDPFEERLGLLRPLLLMACIGVVGWFGGRMVGDSRERWLMELPARVATEDVGARPGLMAKGVMYATALSDRPSVYRSLAGAAMTAAEVSPRRMGYYGNARELLLSRTIETVREETPLERFITSLGLASILGELEDYGPAFAAVDEAEEALPVLNSDNLARSWRLHLVNMRAWLLATAPAAEGGDPARALELSNLMIAARDRLPDGRYPSESAELLDTLAMARFKNGLLDEAVEAQSLALGLADSRGLEVYLRHFDMFSEGKENVQ